MKPEAAQEKLIAQRKDSTKELTRFGQVSETVLAELMALTQARFTHTPLNEIQATVFLEDWKRLAEEFGITQFRSGLELTWTKLKFFPLPGEIRAECESLEVPEPRIPEYKHFEPPADPITKEEFSAMLDKFPQLNAMREPK